VNRFWEQNQRGRVSLHTLSAGKKKFNGQEEGIKGVKNRAPSGRNRGECGRLKEGMFVAASPRAQRLKKWSKGKESTQTSPHKCPGKKGGKAGRRIKRNFNSVSYNLGRVCLTSPAPYVTQKNSLGGKRLPR